jgi:hypothetical protein
MPTSAAQAGTSNDSRANDSANASTNTIGGAQASCRANELDDLLGVAFEGGNQLVRPGGEFARDWPIH